MNAPLKQSAYPMYFILDWCMLAFVGPKIVYKIEPRGTNSFSEGIAIDRYKTRTMVNKLFRRAPYGMMVPEEIFKDRYRKLFYQTLNKITSESIIIQD